MSWAPKRFWTTATAEPEGDGYAVRLDGKPVKTPAKAPLVMPTLTMAQAVAAEWDAQQGTVKPETMPATRSANSAIDKIGPQRAEVAGLIAAYGASDLLCYRATHPEKLVARQAEGWDPLLDWAKAEFGAELQATQGIMPVEQSPEAVARLTQAVNGFSDFELAGFHDLVAISGSLILALAVTRDRLSIDQAWALARIDDDWQAETWGADEEEAAIGEKRHAAFLDAHRFYGLCR